MKRVTVQIYVSVLPHASFSLKAFAIIMWGLNSNVNFIFHLKIVLKDKI